MRCVGSGVFVLCGVWLGTPLAAESTLAEPRRISLGEAVAAAAGLPELLAAQAGERGAGAAVRVAGAWGEPAVGFQTNSVTAREAASLSWALPLTRGSRVAAARADVVLRARSRALALAAARAMLRVAWFSLAAAEQRSQAVAERTARAERNAEAVGAMFEAGRVSRLDQVRARADLALARAEHASAEDARATAAARLGLLMSLPADGTLATDDRAAAEPEPDLTSYLERARAAAPSVLVQEAQAAGALARFTLARRGRWPLLSLSAGAEWNDPTQPGTNKWVGIGVGIPLGASAAADVAAAERDREAALFARERRLAEDAAQGAWRGARAARLRFEAIETEALPAAREAAELTRLAYREGRADLFRVLEAERTLTDALTLRADALEAWGLAFADLKQLGGEDTP